MRTIRIRERRLSLRFRETVLLAGTLACSVLFVATQSQIGLLCYAVAPILLLAFLCCKQIWCGVDIRPQGRPSSWLLLLGLRFQPSPPMHSLAWCTPTFFGHLA